MQMENVKLCKTKDEFCEYIDNYPGELYVKGCNAYKVEGKDKVLIATIEKAMDANDLKNLNDKQLDRMLDLSVEAYQIMRRVVELTGEDRFKNKMYVTTMRINIAIFNEIKNRLNERATDIW